jgi:hypothetical protein
MALSFHNIAHILNLQGNYTDCLNYFIRERQILETYLLSNDPDITESLYQIGLTYEKLKQLASAVENSKQTIEIY